MSDKDKIMAKIKELETLQVNVTDQRDEDRKAADDFAPEFKAIEKAYEQVKEQFQRAETFLREKRNSVRELTDKEKSLTNEIEAAKRELARLLDAEQVNQAYIEEVEAFRAKSLEATWRKENREDGYGAFVHQIEGAIHLAVTKEVVLGDKRGLGKSCTAIAALDLLDIERAIIISPSDLVDNLIRELELWTPHRHRTVWKLAEMNPNQRNMMLPLIREQPQWTVILSYSSWRRDRQLVRDLVSLDAEALLLDEAHHAKTWDTTTCEGVRDIRFGFNKCPGCGDNVNPSLIQVMGSQEIYAECMRCHHSGVKTEFSTLKYVVPMTGTAIMNRPQELFPLLHLVDPVGFPDEKAFLYDFCYQAVDEDTGRRYWKWAYGGEKRCLEKIGPRYLSRRKEDTDVIIPPFQNIDHIIPMAEMKEFYPKQWQAYQQARQYAQLVLDPDSKLTMTMVNKLSVMMRLRQILVWPAGIELKYTDENGEEHIVGRLNVEESIKIDKAVEEIVEAHEEGERTVLFSMFKPGLAVIQKKLQDKGIRAAVYDGSTSREVKGQIERDFDPKFASGNSRWDCVLANYRSAGEGLNFNSASNEILLDRHWHGAGEEQAAGRVNRIGTNRDSTIRRLMVADSVDTYMAEIVESKNEITESFESQARLLQGAYDAILRGDM